MKRSIDGQYGTENHHGFKPSLMTAFSSSRSNSLSQGSFWNSITLCCEGRDLDPNGSLGAGRLSTPDTGGKHCGHSKPLAHQRLAELQKIAREKYASHSPGYDTEGRLLQVGSSFVGLTQFEIKQKVRRLFHRIVDSSGDRQVDRVSTAELLLGCLQYAETHFAVSA